MQCHHIFSEGSSCLSSQPKEEGKGILGCFIGGIQQCNVTISSHKVVRVCPHNQKKRGRAYLVVL